MKQNVLKTNRERFVNSLMKLFFRYFAFGQAGLVGRFFSLSCVLPFICVNVHTSVSSRADEKSFALMLIFNKISGSQEKKKREREIERIISMVIFLSLILAPSARRIHR